MRVDREVARGWGPEADQVYKKREAAKETEEGSQWGAEKAGETVSRRRG